MGNLKKFNTFANENMDPDIDPYGEEIDEDELKDEEENEYSMDNFHINDQPFVETTWTFNVSVGEYDVTCKLIEDDNGYLDLEYVEDVKLPISVSNFLDEYSDEIKIELRDNR